MNDNRERVRANGVGMCEPTKNTAGNQIRPGHLTVLKTVIAIALPSTLRDAVPNVVSAPSDRAAALAAGVSCPSALTRDRGAARDAPRGRPPVRAVRADVARFGVTASASAARLAFDVVLVVLAKSCPFRLNLRQGTSIRSGSAMIVGTTVEDMTATMGPCDHTAAGALSQ